ncbi:hypothetical protein EVAR_67701_1 [Eumeta japonica]|uniref:Uncharacterized protein n=1 Tax=Eumeta variegata TaxID=151549 RepID=A0A4C2A6Z8_EUMVA|nr:hypothetical protein EVAR_67701_1 [Eumeta japonica]
MEESGVDNNAGISNEHVFARDIYKNLRKPHSPSFTPPLTFAPTTAPPPSVYSTLPKHPNPIQEASNALVIFLGVGSVHGRR